MTKFKIGDEVVVLETASYYISTYVGKELQVTGSFVVCKEVWCEFNSILRNVKENDLELTAVYNSPLYQALK